MKIFMKLVYQYNTGLPIVDEDDNGEFRLERVIR